MSNAYEHTQEIVDQYFTAALQGICANSEYGAVPREAMAEYARESALCALKQRKFLCREANQQDTNDARSAHNECHVNTRARNNLAAI
jgi:hypothetical protein